MRVLQSHSKDAPNSTKIAIGSISLLHIQLFVRLLAEIEARRLNRRRIRQCQAPKFGHSSRGLYPKITKGFLFKKITGAINAPLFLSPPFNSK